jgi:ribosomal protein L37AE/L43A
MNGALIQEVPCPRCSNPRTVRVSGLSFCFNCHWQWSGASGASQPDADPEYRFTATELARLTTYRAAVRAGFYNDR